MKKRLFAILTAVMMLVSMFPVRAEDGEVSETVVNEPVQAYSHIGGTIPAGTVCTCEDCLSQTAGDTAAPADPVTVTEESLSQETDLPDELPSEETPEETVILTEEDETVTAGEDEEPAETPEETVVLTEEDETVTAGEDEEPAGTPEETVVLTEEDETVTAGEDEEPAETPEETVILTEEDETATAGEDEEPAGTPEETVTLTEEEETVTAGEGEEPAGTPEETVTLTEDPMPFFGSSMMLMSTAPAECTHPQESLTYTPDPEDPNVHIIHCAECDTDIGTDRHDFVVGTDNGDGTHALACRYCGQTSFSDHYVNCTDPGVCAGCGASVTADVPVFHSLNTVINENGTHTQFCTDCDYSVTEEHYVSCDAGDTTACSVCGTAVDGPVRHTNLGWQCDGDEHYQYCWNCSTEIPDTRGTHTADESVWETDECNHYHPCATCGMPLDSQSHFNCMGGDTCLVCGKSGTADGIQLNTEHNYKSVYIDGETHKDVCAGCGLESGTYPHSVSCADPTVCAFCGATGLSGYTPEHSLSYTSNGNGTHTVSCWNCDYSVTEDHYAYCGAEDKTVCGVCNEACGTELPLQHFSIGINFDSNEHYQYCWSCNTEIPDTREAHTVDDTVWSADEYNHFHVCSVCDARMDDGNHINCEGGDTCLVCGKNVTEDGIVLQDNHSLIYEYVDENNHLQVCEYCGKKFNTVRHTVSCTDPSCCEGCGADIGQIADAEVQHVYDQGKYVPLEDGVHHAPTCDLCGAVAGWSDTHTVSCQDPTVCTVCGATGLAGQEALHSFKYEDQNDGTHLITCEYCDYSVTEAHYINCGISDDGMCSACGAETGEELPERHQGIGWTTDGDEHYQYCWYCNTEIPDTRGTHTPDETTLCSNEYNHYYLCTVCNNPVNSQSHVNCQGGTVCMICGREDPAEMMTEHQAESVPHPGEDWYDLSYYTVESDPARHYMKCTCCGEYYGGEFHSVDYETGKCMVCGAEPVYCENEEDHVWVWVVSMSGHWQVCEKCSKNQGNWGDHNDCDRNGSCDICGCALTDEYTWNEDHQYEQQYNETQHWSACIYCGQEEEGVTREDHSFADGHDESKHWQECEACGYRINEEEHTPGDDWCMDPDGTVHYKECSVCGEIIGDTFEEHVFEYVIGAETHEEACSVCHYSHGEQEHDYRTVKAMDDEEHTLVCDCGAEMTGEHEWSGWYSDDENTNTSTHYMTCGICDKQKTETSVLHWNLPVVYDRDGHHQICSVEGCDWNNWEMTQHCRTCNDAPGVCTDPNCTYEGEIDDSTMYISHAYVFTAESAYAHTGVCAYCGDTVKYSHCDDDGDGICDGCGYGAEEEDEILTCVLHTADKMEYDEFGHWYTCTVCGNMFDYSNHGDCAGGNVCRLCGMPEAECENFIAGGHYYITSPVHDSEYHYYTCAYCGKNDRGPHSESCTDPGVCVDWQCGATAAEGAVFGETVHEYYPDDVEYDEYSHWYICRNCGQVVNKDAHWSNNGLTCAVCSINMSDAKVCEEHDVDYTDLRSNDWGHYYICKTCGMQVDWESHYNCTSDERVCAVCGAVPGEEAYFETEHWYDYDIAPEDYDDYTHVRYCTRCGGGAVYEPHSLNWDNGTQTYYCEQCGAKDLKLHACQFDGWQQDTNHLHHYQECTLCHAVCNCETHTDEDGDGICDVCEQPAVICNHENGYIAIWAGDGYTYAHDVFCRFCHEHYRTEAHVDADGDGICDLCLEGPVAVCTSHVWAKDGNGKYLYNSDEDAHYLYCEKCWATGTVTEHVMSSWVAGSDYHMRSCRACGYTEYEMHSLCGGSQCKVCGQPKAECSSYMDHYYDVKDVGSDEYHQQICRYCGDKQNNPHGRSCTEPEGVCDMCGREMDDSLLQLWHITDGVYEHDGFSHWDTCLVCGETVWTSRHYDNNEDGFCDDAGCGAEIEPCPGHEYGNWEPCDNWNHRRVCSVCGAEEYETHYNCAGGDTCLACGEKKTTSVHLDTYHQIADYNVYDSDASSHWNVCERCGEPQNKETHYDWNYDGICDLCSHLIGHDHTWTQDSKNSVAATCTADGKNVYTCPCGETKEETVAKTGHRYEVTATAEATCAAPGTKTYTCAACGDAYSEKVSEMTDHTWAVTGVTAPTCVADGATHYECTGCKATRDEAIPATGEHDWAVTGTDDPTCVADGTTHYECTGCKATRDEAIPATGEHDWTVTGTDDPTCVADGTTHYECAVCKATRDEAIAATGNHVWNETARRNATCTETGSVTYVCAQCGAVRNETLALIDHDWQETDRLDATCTADGYADYICSVCGETRHDELSATGHSYGEYTSNLGSTHSRICSACGDVDTQGCQWNTVEIGDIRCSTCTVCHFVKTEIIGMENLNDLTAANAAVAKEVSTENVKIEIDLSLFADPAADPEDPEQKPVETRLTISESSEALPENSSVVKIFNINLEVNGETKTNVGQKVKLSVPLTELSDMTEIEKDTTAFKMFVLGENGELIAVDYEIVDGMLILDTEVFGMFVMLTAEEAALLTK